ncbi:hypothetical protein A2634_05395 [Candidatus Amesbacteria bacterium RIFCSPHIGHO2_01_FULL_48_32]|uniref:Type 4 fimbrial biogenesis protein PilX N-terminal domain-containing protein n=1 Tax=Candidatus Amesbacteria bacterium RIFCSPLOWO2_01_FULL_48_25 TaxID=1797259 RepID=A0A1F4ZCV3_9BACT|nr:MAG: hypothetical protein A2634_05395 [Candidatus Amesbacteria bacterium RIFCSPHIGHO2_01_FULL_48_32]OGD04101.1 MAG: hypothetical protein A2989_01745 [Candidatus Amesbacteria bacterium RIFCSPLOWO2_01_FULL_48_25]HJZ05632.1 hypothetical protein [Patescibacteria group bacterium]
MKRAFTIVEILIYMGLMAGFLVILGSILISVLDVQLETQSVSAVEQDGRYIMARLAYDIHRASSISTPGTAGLTTNSLGLDIGTYAVVSGNLQFAGQNLNSYDSQITGFTVTRLGTTTHPSLQITLDLASRSSQITGVAKTKSYLSTVSLRDK